MFNQEVLDKVGGVGGGIVMAQLPVTSLPGYRLFALHCIMQSTENTVLLVNSVTIWCVLMVKENLCDRRKLPTLLSPCSELGVPLLVSEIPESSTVMPGFCFRVVPIDPSYITGNFCLHEVHVLINTLQQISGYGKSCLLLDCQ